MLTVGSSTLQDRRAKGQDQRDIVSAMQSPRDTQPTQRSSGTMLWAQGQNQQRIVIIKDERDMGQDQ